MRLLICTQKVDRVDPVLGFFHRWLLEFSRHFEFVSVICLEEGEHELPKNVLVYSLGKEKKRVSSLSYSLRFLRLIKHLRSEYDVVFVHMNPEYALLGGLFWRFWKKPVGLWYVHKTVSLRLRAAVALVSFVFTASKESFRLTTRKLHVLGHGIDTDFFTPDSRVIRGSHVLSAGRLSKSKHHDLVITAAKKAGRMLRIAGEGPELDNLKRLANDMGANVAFLGAVSQEQLRREYQEASHFIHASTTGSLDKVVLEAIACDCSVITTARGVFQDVPIHEVEATPDAIANAVSHYVREDVDRVDFIRKKHSLSRLIPAIQSVYQAKHSPHD